jgi:predicted Fe-S protein YdhL (DUF1289 family)
MIDRGRSLGHLAAQETRGPMIPSPCNKICTLNENDVCVGCGRNRREIGSWSQLSDGEKKRVIGRAKERLETLGEQKMARK